MGAAVTTELFYRIQRRLGNFDQFNLPGRTGSGGPGHESEPGQITGSFVFPLSTDTDYSEDKDCYD